MQGVPAEREGEPHDVGAPQSRRSLDVDARLAIQHTQAEHPDEMQPHDDDGQARDDGQGLVEAAEQGPEGRGGCAQGHEDGREARHEQQACQKSVAPGARGIPVLQVFEGGPGQKAQVGRDQRQHAGAEEGQQAGEESRGEGNVGGHVSC